MNSLTPKEEIIGAITTFGLWTARRLCHIPEEGFLNHRLLSIRPLTIEDMLNQAWKEKCKAELRNKSHKVTTRLELTNRLIGKDFAM